MSGKISPELGWFEPIRSLAFGGIGLVYAPIGAEIDHPTRVFIINNTTDIPVVISFDGISSHLLLMEGVNYIIDTASNGISLPKGTIFYVRQGTAVAATEGLVAVSIGYNVKI